MFFSPFLILDTFYKFDLTDLSFYPHTHHYVQLPNLFEKSQTKTILNVPSLDYKKTGSKNHHKKTEDSVK